MECEDHLIHHREQGDYEGEEYSTSDSPSFAIKEGGTCWVSLECKGHKLVPSSAAGTSLVYRIT